MFRHHLKALCLALTVLVIGACSTTYKVDQRLVDAFEHVPVEPNQTGVYVIRGSKFQGGGRGAWIAVNDHVVTSLSNGSHVYLPVESGLNTIHGVQALAGFGYATADDLPGETIFLELDYVKGTLAPVDPALGKTMVAKTKVSNPLPEPRKNDALENQLLNPGLLDYEVMVLTTEKLAPDATSALVTFYRTSRLLATSAFDIWNQDGYIGSTKGNTYFQVKLAPGKHTFVAISEQYSLLEADLEAGKEYAVDLSVVMGWNQAHIKLLPIDLVNDKKFAQKVAKTEARAVDASVVQSTPIARRIERGFPLVQAALGRRQAGDLNARVLPASFGRH